ncbi:MAG TPA: hypothetical protein VFG83_02095 [Kofleriaceae bacterium]|nr:hypothetical protein [Kofleriaceae bacterium]
MVAVSVAAVLAGAGRASAWPNPPPIHHREGFALTVGVGPGGLVGTGGKDALAGLGAGLGLAIKTTAGDDLLWMIKIDGESYLFRALDDQIKVNQQTILAAGAQLYVRKVLWIEGGLGAAVARQRDRKTGLDDHVSTGIGALFAVGYDLYRRESFVLAIAGCTGVGVYNKGMAAHGGIRLSVGWY